MRNNKRNGKFGIGNITSLLFLLIIIVVIIIIVLVFSSDKQDEEPAVSEPIVSASPDVTISPEPEEMETAVPSPSEEPGPKPSETPSPEPAQTPTTETIASGSFMSDTGTKLNLVADWTAVSAGDGQALVTIKLYVESYTLHVNSMPAAIEIGDQKFSVTSKAVDCDSDSATVKTEIASVQTTLSLGSGGTLDIPVSSVWYFKGTYSDQEFESIEASGNIIN